VALPLACPKDCLKSVVPLKLWKLPDVGVTVRPCWGEFDEVRTGVKVVDPCEAAACNKVANCSGLYSVFGILAGLGSLVTADMLGNRTEVGGGGGM